jgi:hypothetical protein
MSADLDPVRHELNDEAIALLSLSLSALVDASAVFPSVIKTDLHACILHIFATILATPSCQTTVVPQALPIFKRFLTSIVTNPQPETSTQLRNSLTRFLAIIKHAQQREFEAATQCEKNALLACTVLLSSAGSVFEPDDPLLERFISELADCLENRLPTKVAANCARSILLLPKRNTAEEALASLLLPHLLAFVATPSDVEGLEESRPLVAHSLTAFVQQISKDKVAMAMAIVVPALLARASKEGSAAYKEIAVRLLELAAADQNAFRSVAGGLSGEQRSFLEEVIREGGAKRVVEQRGDSGEPSIALKMDFGNAG